MVRRGDRRARQHGGTGAATRPPGVQRSLARAVQSGTGVDGNGYLKEVFVMKGVWLLLIAAISLGGCRGGDGGEAPVSGETRPLRDGPTRPPEAHMEGNYHLEYADGTGLPAILERANGCHTEVIDGTLRIEGGRFAFQNRVREVCGGVAREPVIHAAGGQVIIQGNQVRLEADVGGAFIEATGIADETSILIQQMTSTAGPQNVSWRFDRLGPELVPEEGMEDRTPAGDGPAPGTGVGPGGSP
jgi:hypothetical protein